MCAWRVRETVAVVGLAQIRCRGSSAMIKAATVATIGPSAGVSPRANAPNDPTNQPVKNQRTAAAIRFFMWRDWSPAALEAMVPSVGGDHTEVQSACHRAPLARSRVRSVADDPGTFDLRLGVTMRTVLSRRRTQRPRTRGQSLAEFAIVFPVFMVMLGGAIQFGIIFWGQNSLNQVVRDLGRYGVTEPGNCAQTRTNIVNKAPSVAAGVTIGTFTLSTSDVVIPAAGSTIATCPPASNQEIVWMTITGHLQVPTFFPFVPGNGTLTSTATFRLEPVNP
jgi:TadE-like protein